MIAAGRFYHAAVFNERGQSLTDIAGAHAHDSADVLQREGLARIGENLFDAFPAGRLGCRRRNRLLIQDLQSEHRWMVFEYERHPISTCSGAMLDTEQQLLPNAT